MAAARLVCQVQALKWHVWRRRICQSALLGREQLAETCAGPATLSGSWLDHGVVGSWKLSPPPVRRPLTSQQTWQLLVWRQYLPEVPQEQQWKWLYSRFALQDCSVD